MNELLLLDAYYMLVIMLSVFQISLLKNPSKPQTTLWCKRYYPYSERNAFPRGLSPVLLSQARGRQFEPSPASLQVGSSPDSLGRSHLGISVFLKVHSFSPARGTALRGGGGYGTVA